MTIDVVKLELKLIEIVITEADNTRTGDNRDEIVITKGYDSIIRSYKEYNERYERGGERV